jgi:hypothetical protein
MHIELCIPHRAVFLALQSIFEDFENVKVVHESIVNAQHDTLITFGNSFVDADKTIRTIFGEEIEEKLKAVVKDKFAGKMSVGQAFVMSVEHPKYKWLIYAPAMEFPHDVSSLCSARRAYMAFKGALLVMRDAGIQTASAPFFRRDGDGWIAAANAGRQMRAALESIVRRTL